MRSTISLYNEYFDGDLLDVSIWEDDQEPERNYVVVAFDNTDFPDITFALTGEGELYMKYYEEDRDENGKVVSRVAIFHKIGNV